VYARGGGSVATVTWRAHDGSGKLKLMADPLLLIRDGGGPTSRG